MGAGDRICIVGSLKAAVHDSLPNKFRGGLGAGTKIRYVGVKLHITVYSFSHTSLKAKGCGP